MAKVKCVETSRHFSISDVPNDVNLFVMHNAIRTPRIQQTNVKTKFGC
jgi:hypothetical protein